MRPCGSMARSRPSVAAGVLWAVMVGMAGPLLAADTASPYRVDWDEAVGLWRRSGSGHTDATRDLREVHAGPTAADRLLAAALDGQLANLPVGRVLAALESMQDVEGPRAGCFRWYYEDHDIGDTNAAFFIGLPLIALRAEFAAELAAADRAVLDRMLHRLRMWCDREVASPVPRYPNKYLGDLVCAWLLAEQCAAPAATERAARMLDAARYWREQEWGWGEHMSDAYACVCLDELSMLLLLSKQLPPDVRTAYEQLRDELLRIDDLYAGGPRVPAIRSYAFHKAPTAVSYRTAVRPWKTADLLTAKTFQTLRGLAHRRGWHAVVPPPVPTGKRIEVACHGNARAMAVIDGPLRLGAMSRYPIMDGIDQRTWGLAWQSFPVAAWHAAGDWCFLQWEAAANGRRRTHPAESMATSYRDNALSHDLEPPPVGQTFAVRHGTAFVILRRMPRIANAWPEVVDRVRLRGRHAQLEELQDAAGHQLRLTYAADGAPPRRLCIRFCALDPELVPHLRHDSEQSVDWSVRHPLGPAARAQPPLGVWVWSLGDDLTAAPRIEQIDAGWRLSWEQGTDDFVVRVVPAAIDPLRVE